MLGLAANHAPASYRDIVGRASPRKNQIAGDSLPLHIDEPESADKPPPLCWLSLSSALCYFTSLRKKRRRRPRRSQRRLFPLSRLRLSPPRQKAAVEAPPKRKATRLRPRSQPYRPQQSLRPLAKHRRLETKRMRRPNPTRPRAPNELALEAQRRPAVTSTVGASSC